MPAPPSPSSTASTPLSNTIVLGNGNWSSGVTLSNGSNSLKAEVTDLAGNTATSAAVVITLNDPPTGSVTIGGTASEETQRF